jgi:hypothetical protein
MRGIQDKASNLFTQSSETAGTQFLKKTCVVTCVVVLLQLIQAIS